METNKVKEVNVDNVIPLKQQKFITEPLILLNEYLTYQQSLLMSMNSRFGIVMPLLLHGMQMERLQHYQFVIMLSM